MAACVGVGRFTQLWRLDPRGPAVRGGAAGGSAAGLPGLRRWSAVGRRLGWACPPFCRLHGVAAC